MKTAKPSILRLPLLLSEKLNKVGVLVVGGEPTTNNQQPTTNNQQPTTNNQQPNYFSGDFKA
ncbi:MAG: hypothetical protein ACHBN1_32090 [Heteroscytonema crispum UTEX LB 1556]